jgi:hypothetical protein
MVLQLEAQWCVFRWRTVFGEQISGSAQRGQSQAAICLSAGLSLGGFLLLWRPLAVLLKLTVKVFL